MGWNVVLQAPVQSTHGGRQYRALLLHAGTICGFTNRAHRGPLHRNPLFVVSWTREIILQRPSANLPSSALYTDQTNDCAQGKEENVFLVSFSRLL